MMKDNMIGKLNKLHQNDRWVNEIMAACGNELDNLDAEVKQFVDNLFLDTANKKGIDHYEHEAEIKPIPQQTLRDRAAVIGAKWKSDVKVDKQLLEQVARAWKDGDVEIGFIEGKIQITFTSEYGVPRDTGGLEIALDEVKPAHLPIVYFVRYILVKTVHGMPIAELQTHKIREFTFYKTIPYSHWSKEFIDLSGIDLQSGVYDAEKGRLVI